MEVKVSFHKIFLSMQELIYRNFIFKNANKNKYQGLEKHLYLYTVKTNRSLVMKN